MALEQLNIEIIDTYTNSRTLIDEDTRINAPHLIYNGQEDKFQSIMTSELHFNMLVKTGADAVFEHLYTSYEDRYKVVLSDLTDALNPVVYWTGFLLPEQFNEPYINDVFFVDFIATDGIGQLKTKYLADEFYTDNKTITSIIAGCLSLTNKNFNIYIAEAITQTLVDINYDKILINTSSYVEKDKKKDAYSILQKIMISIGCKLFMHQDAWYIIGINRFSDTSIAVDVFDYLGVFTNTATITREVVPIFFKNSSQISLEPEIKEVSVNWKNEYGDNVLPDDIIHQLPTEPIDFNTYVPIKYWQGFGTADISLDTKDFTKVAANIFAEPAYYREQITTVVDKDPWWITMLGMGITILDDYIELIDPIYLDTELNEKANLSIEIELIAFTNHNLDAYFYPASSGSDAEPTSDYDNSFKYKILLDNNILIDNISSSTYNFKVRQFEDTKIKATLKLDKLPVVKNAYMQFRLSIPIAASGAAITKTVISKFTVNYDTLQDETITKTRSIPSSVVKDIDVFHADDDKDFTNRQYLIDDSVVWGGITINTPVEIIDLSTSNYYEFAHPKPPNDILYHELELTYQSFIDIQNYPDDVNLKAGGTLPLVPITVSDYIILESLDKYYIRMYDIATWFSPGDTVALNIPASTENITDKRYLRERWKRFDKTEEIRFIEALALINHEVMYKPQLKVSGTALGIISPLSVLDFNYKSATNYLPVAFNVDLVNGDSEIIMIDQSKQEVTDYVN